MLIKIKISVYQYKQWGLQFIKFEGTTWHRALLMNPKWKKIQHFKTEKNATWRLFLLNMRTKNHQLLELGLSHKIYSEYSIYDLNRSTYSQRGYENTRKM